MSSRKHKEASKEVIKKAKERSFIIGLLPFKEDKKSIEFLFNREIKRKHFKDSDKKERKEKTKEHYLRVKKVILDISNKVVYINNRGAEKVADEIFELF